MAGYLGIEASDLKPFVFISYNNEDQERLYGIMKHLERHEISIWYDNGIKRVSDEEWKEQIAIHIREASILFFFISKGIFVKSDSFVRKEYDLAVRHSKKMCIVLLDEIDNKIIPAKYDFWWGEIQNKQCINTKGLSDEDISNKIWEECCELDEFKDNIKCDVSSFILINEEKRLVIDLTKGMHVLGRYDRKCDIVIDDDFVSGIHACITVSEFMVYIKDLHAMNGTMVNGKIIVSGEEVALNIGDVIRIGNTDLLLNKIIR